jgi:uncharacterized protein
MACPVKFDWTSRPLGVRLHLNLVQLVVGAPVAEYNISTRVRPPNRKSRRDEGGFSPSIWVVWELPMRPATVLVLVADTRRRTMKELVEAIAKALVDEPDQVQVRVIEGEQVTVLELRVHPSDLGMVIGRQGRMAESLRIILGAAGTKLRRRVVLEIVSGPAPAR